MPSQVRLFVGFQTDVSLFGTNPVFMRVLSMNFEVNSDSDISQFNIYISSGAQLEGGKKG